MLKNASRLVAAMATAFLLAVPAFQVPVVAVVAYRRTLEADAGWALSWLGTVGVAGGFLWAGSRSFAGWFGLVGQVVIGFGVLIGFGLLIGTYPAVRHDPMLQMIGLFGVVSIVSLGAACIAAQRRADAAA